MFGKYYKHVLILTLLAWMTYTLPTVRAAIQGDSSDPSLSAAAAIQPFAGMMERGRPDLSSSSMPASGDFHMMPKGTSSSTMPVSDVPEMRKKPLPPQELIGLLVKLGYIDPSKADQARQDVDKYLSSNHASSTPRMENGPRFQDDSTSSPRTMQFRGPATSTRPMTPLPPQRNDGGRF